MALVDVVVDEPKDGLEEEEGDDYNADYGVVGVDLWIVMSFLRGDV